MIPIITIEGATATGKSALAIELAEALGTEIISADSRQIYKGMNIGTAKVNAEDRNRVKHHLIDIIAPHETYNAGAFGSDATRIINDLHTRKKIPIVCGGTGLYISTLINGLCALPEISSELKKTLTARLDNEGLESLYSELKKVDPEFACKISCNDRQRTLRALEVYHGTGFTLSQHWAQQDRTGRFRSFRILMESDRSSLYRRIEFRLGVMLQMGLLDEIRELLQGGYNEDTPGLKCLGYKEFIPHLQGDVTLPVAVEIAAQHQRNLAKRQITWNRKYRFDLTLDAQSVKISDIITKIQDFIS